jgi:hypothetical protein
MCQAARTIASAVAIFKTWMMSSMDLSYLLYHAIHLSLFFYDGSYEKIEQSFENYWLQHLTQGFGQAEQDLPPYSLQKLLAAH